MEPLTQTSNAEIADPLGSQVEAGAPLEHAPTAASSWPRARVAVDAIMLLAAMFGAELGAHAAGVPATPARWLLYFSLLVIALSYWRGAYAWRIRLQAIDDLWSVVATTALAGMIVLSMRVLLGDDATVAAQSLRLWAFAAVYVGAGRIALDWSQVTARRHGELAKPTLVVGAGNVGRLIAKRLLDHPEFGLKPVGFLDKEPREGATPLPVLGASWSLDEVVERHRIQHVIVTFSTAPSEVLLRLVKRCDELDVGVSLVPRLYEQMNERLSVEHIGGLPLLSVRRISPKGWQFAVKHALDRVITLLLMPVALPLLAAAAFAVYITMGRPVFFKQLRVGRDGRVFAMLKFRTMRDPEEEDAAVSPDLLEEDTAPGGVEGSDRRTRIGSILRTSSIDELPQLLNVLKGQMSLVGPRPERPEFVKLFEERVHGYEDRHRVKAGITGWAQVHGLRGKTSISDRAEWDNYYIENWSLWLDLKILLMTLVAIAGARAVE